MSAGQEKLTNKVCAGQKKMDSIIKRHRHRPGRVESWNKWHQGQTQKVHKFHSGQNKYWNKRQGNKDKHRPGWIWRKDNGYVTYAVKAHKSNGREGWNLHKEFSSELEATWWDFAANLVAVQTRTRCIGSGNVGITADKVKFHKSLSLAVHHQQFKAMAVHNDWAPRKKPHTHMLSIL